MFKTLTTIVALALGMAGTEVLFAQANLRSVNLAPKASVPLEGQVSPVEIQAEKPVFGEPTSVGNAARPKPKCCKPAQMCCPAKHCCVAG